MDAALLAVALCASPAQRLEAERLARQSITDYNVGDFDSALKEATAAYKIDPRPALLFNLGQVHRAMHHWERAEFFYRGYLRGRPDAPNRTEVEKLIQEMETRQTGVPHTVPAPAVTVTPLPQPVRAPARAPASAPAQVPLVIESQPPPAPAPPPPAPTPAPSLEPPAPQVRTITAAEPGVTGEEQPPEVKTKRHTAGYVLGGVTLAAAGMGFASLAESYTYQQWYNNEKTTSTPTPPPWSPGQAKTWAISAYVLGGVAAAALIGAFFAW